ncbi:hypothetical protein GGF32_002715 [Allomyces javanicus]|nr:hypothetical protein GGF32_002715 [Allomyces javanicus]
MTIYLLSGWMGSGKDTAGEYLVSKYGIKRYAFADALKDAVSRAFSVPIEWTHTQAGKATYIDRLGKTVRDVLIDFGTNARAKDPLVWVKHVVKEIGPGDAVITDWRLLDDGGTSARW